MNEITPEESEAVIAAASRGEVVPGHQTLGEMLTELHGPAGADAAAPTPLLVAPASRATARFARRTAVAASVAVLSLSGVAAAATAGIEILAPGSASPDVAEAVIDEAEEATEEATEEADGSTDAPVDKVAEDEGDAGAGVDEAGEEPEADAADPDAEDDKGPNHLEDRVDGVDPDDDNGLSDEEIDDLCEAAERHGEFVSVVARNKSVDPEASHGERVSEAAQRDDCGKPDNDFAEGEDPEAADADADADDADADDADDDDDDADADDADDDDDDDDDEGAGNGQGHGRDDAPGQNKDKSNNGRNQSNR